MTTRRQFRVALLYKRYLGINGLFYEYKVLASQFVTVALQAASKLKLMAASAVVIGNWWLYLVGSVGYWFFLAVLVLNAVAPSLLLSFDSVRVRREGMALFDIACDALYVAYFFSAMSHASSGAQLTPTDPVNFAASIYPLLHILATARALERAVVARLEAQRRGAGAQQTERPRSFTFRAAKVVAAATLLVLVLGMSAADSNYGLRVNKVPSCGRLCECDASSTLYDCSRGARSTQLLQPNGVGMNFLGITAIEPGAFRRFRGVSIPSFGLGWNKITSLQAGVFEGLDEVQELFLTRNSITSVEAGAFDGLENLKKLWYRPRSNRSLTCADLANQTVLPADVKCVADRDGP